MTKILIFDSGALITLSMNGLTYLLEKLKKTFHGKFIITEEVKYEVIDRPIKVPRFELEALRIKKLLTSNILELPSSLNIDNKTIKSKTRKFMEIANQSVSSKGRWIKIISEGETSCLALSSELTKRNIENIIAIDERTTRILAEKPQNLEQIMSKKLKQKVSIEKKTIIGGKVKIGDNVVIEQNATVLDDAVVPSGTVIKAENTFPHK